MTKQSTEVPTQIPKPPLWKRHHKKLIALVVLSMLCIQIPLLGYVGRVFLSVMQFGVGQSSFKALQEHTDWFMRYFTGPPSDAEMIAHFKKHRANFERLAYITITQGYCFDLERRKPGQECTQLEKEVEMKTGISQITLINSAFRPRTGPCGTPCQVQEYFYSGKEWQQWLGTKNPKINTWEKNLIYVPPLLPAEQFALDLGRYPANSLNAIRKACFMKQSLDSIPTELEAKPGSHAFPNCAVRHIEGQWFLKLTPHNILDF
jgi:hypothetical protein